MTQKSLAVAVTIFLSSLPVCHQCNTTCGRGVKTRQVVCSGLEDGVFKEFHGQMCDSALKPEESSACFERPCSKWFTTSWSQVHVVRAIQPLSLLLTYLGPSVTPLHRTLSRAVSSSSFHCYLDHSISI